MYKQLFDKIRGSLSAPLHARRGLGWLCLFLCVQTYVSANTSSPSIQEGAREGSPTGALILRSPQDYQVYAISPNGEWATGVYVNYSNMGYGFRWNLLTDKVELLSGDLCLSEGTAVSNEGVVVGMFDDTEATDNGAPAYTAGYWENGQWHHLPNINNAPVFNNEEVGYANAISTDGVYMGGAYNDKNSRLIPLIWKNGQIEHIFTQEEGYEGMIYTVSADGQKAAGWSTTPNSEQARVATVWEVGKGATLIMDERLSNAWCSARKFSPNGKWLLFWEGYYDTPADQIADPTASNMALRALYNMETGEKTDMPTITRDPFNFDVFDINDNGTIVGYESPEATQLDQAVIFKDGKTRWLYDYLKEQGVDMDADKSILREGNDVFFIRAVGISNDEKTFAVLYYDTVGALRSMIIKLDENLTTRPPVQLEVAPLAGVMATRVNWEAPISGADGVTGYNIYRNGRKLNDQPVTGTSYIDVYEYHETDGATRATDLSSTSATFELSYLDFYNVTALYGEVESATSDTVFFDYPEDEIQAPRNLFARQMGYNGGLLMWDAPRTNLTVIDYYDEKDKVTGFGGGNNSFEAAIRIPAEETALYGDFTINSVSFFPMTAQNAWKVNIYKKITEGTRELIYTQSVTQSLSYGKENVVKMDSPIRIPAGADLYVAIEVAVPTDHTGYNVLGEISGKPIPGQTDLLRMTTEPDFYSLYEEGKKFGATQLTTWAIAVNLAASGEKADQMDLIEYYAVYDGTEEIGQTTNCSLSLDALASGEHSLGVKSVYTNGVSSDVVSVPLHIVPNENVFKAISNVDVKLLTSSSALFSWEAPVDNDEVFLTHCTDALQGGVLGPEANNYNYIAATVYSPQKTHGYEGYQITGFRFYPLTTAEYTFFLEEDGKVLCEAWPESYTPGLWNTVALAQPVTIKAGSTYRLLLDCYDVTPQTAPLGLDARMPYIEEGDLYSLNEGATYTSVSQASAFGNWMMGLMLTNPVEKEIPVTGYNIRIDNKVVTPTLLAETSYVHDFGTEEDATHRLNVDVFYEGEREVKGTAIFFKIGATSIDENCITALRLDKKEGYIVVEAEGVTAVSAVNVAGQTVRTANSNLLPVTGMDKGIYLLRIATSDGERTVKIVID